MDTPTIVAVIASITAILIAVFKAPAERREVGSRAESQEADTAEKYQRIASQAADKALKLNERVEQLEIMVEELQADLKRKELENEDMRDWAERLVHQVKSMGGQPVVIRQKGKAAA